MSRGHEMDPRLEAMLESLDRDRERSESAALLVSSLDLPDPDIQTRMSSTGQRLDSAAVHLREARDCATSGAGHEVADHMASAARELLISASTASSCLSLLERGGETEAARSVESIHDIVFSALNGVRFSSRSLAHSARSRYLRATRDERS